MIFPYYKNNRSQAVSYQNPATLARATTSSHTLPIYRRKFNYKFPAPSLFFFKSSTRLRSISPLLLFFFLHKSKSLIFLFLSFFLFLKQNGGGSNDDKAGCAAAERRAGHRDPHDPKLGLLGAVEAVFSGLSFDHRSGW